MIWKQSNNRAVSADIVKLFESAAKEFSVPVGILLGTCECESNFRLGLVSSANAVGPMQFKTKFAADYHRYAGFAFDLTGWESVRGCAAIYAYYARLGARRHGYKGDDCWRYALASHRWGQNSTQAKTLVTAGRITDVETMMRRNGLWYSDTSAPAQTPDKPAIDTAVPARAVAWAVDKVGCPYSQPQRAQEGVYDCSSLVARAYSTQGVDWSCVGRDIPLSCEEPYSDQFELLWPADYARIGKSYGGVAQLNLAMQPGDLQFLCTSSTTGRANKITHVTMVVDAANIVHARGTAYGVRKDRRTLYAGKVCALLRYNPAAPLRKGMRGLRVKALQEALIAKGAAIKADGDYGTKTAAAVAKYGEV